MNQIAAAVLAELDEHALRELADRLRPYLDGTPSTGPAGWLRGAQAIADHIGAPRSRVYALVSAGRIPVHRDGSNLIAQRSELDAWIIAGGALRP